MIVITGASDGLGKELAKFYKEGGKKIVSISRHESATADVSIIADLRELDKLNQVVEKLPKDEPIEVLVNCAGVLSINELNAIKTNELQDVMAVNVEAPIKLVSLLADRIKADKTDIVNVSSSVGTKGYVSQAAYGASKWAMRGFSQNLQAEFKNLPNRVISFCPGGFKTKLFEKATGVDNTGDGSDWMSASEVAKFLKQILDLPKNMEVSEVILNRK